MKAAKGWRRWFTAPNNRFHNVLQELSRAQEKRANDSRTQFAGMSSVAAATAARADSICLKPRIPAELRRAVEAVITV